MSRADDVRTEDYFRAIPATNIGATTYGLTVSLTGKTGWSATLFTNDGAKGNVAFQFSDFTARSKLLLPDILNNMMTSDVTATVNGTAGTSSVQRIARFGDGTCSANIMRITFTPTAGSVGTFWAALTLRAN